MRADAPGGGEEGARTHLLAGGGWRATGNGRRLRLRLREVLSALAAGSGPDRPGAPRPTRPAPGAPAPPAPKPRRALARGAAGGAGGSHCRPQPRRGSWGRLSTSDAEKGSEGMARRSRRSETWVSLGQLGHPLALHPRGLGRGEALRPSPPQPQTCAPLPATPTLQSLLCTPGPRALRSGVGRRWTVHVETPERGRVSNPQNWKGEKITK